MMMIMMMITQILSDDAGIIITINSFDFLSISTHIVMRFSTPSVMIATFSTPRVLNGAFISLTGLHIAMNFARSDDARIFITLDMLVSK